jgi:hypothetical protein
MMQGLAHGEISVSPPDTLVKYDAPLFAGIENHNKAVSQGKIDTNSKLEDMLNAMLPPR